MTAVNESVGDILASSRFSRTPLFYTLYLRYTIGYTEYPALIR